MFDLSKIKIAVIGLGYVGLPLAVEFGKKLPVVGFDINTKRVDELRGGVVVKVLMEYYFKIIGPYIDY